MWFDLKIIWNVTCNCISSHVCNQIYKSPTEYLNVAEDIGVDIEICEYV